MKDFRIKHNLTQKEMSKMMKVSRSTYSCWELGVRKPCLKSKIKIALFYIKYYLRLV